MHHMLSLGILGSKKAERKNIKHNSHIQDALMFCIRTEWCNLKVAAVRSSWMLFSFGEMFTAERGVSLRTRLCFAGTPCSHPHSSTHSHLGAAQLNHSLTFWPTSSFTEAVRALAESHSDDDAGGASLRFHFAQTHCAGLGLEPVTSDVLLYPRRIASHSAT